jgi:hypothetical protein
MFFWLDVFVVVGCFVVVDFGDSCVDAFDNLPSAID